MSWPRRHELMDVDLDAYADDAPAQPSDAAESVAQSPGEIEEEPVSTLEAAERAGVPLEELLLKLNW